MPLPLRHSLFLLSTAAILALPRPAEAAFHLWEIEEVYSNADGTIQPVQMTQQGVGPIPSPEP